MSEIKMLPLPTRLAASGLKSEIVNFAERMVEHNVAARDAEVEALRAEVNTAKGQAEFYRTERNKNQRKAERLAEALRWYANPEVYKPHPHGPAFDDRDLSFKARAALRDHDQQEGETDG